MQKAGYFPVKTALYLIIRIVLGATGGGSGIVIVNL